MALHAVRKPFATVVLVVRDAEPRIVRSLESALNQSLDSIQVVVSDRGSRDRTVAMCRSIAERDIRVDVIENGEVDYAQAFDAALEQARGAYILAMAQDDWLAPGALATLERAVKMHDLELAIMALSVDERMGAGGHASHVLRFSVEPTTDAEAFRDEVPLFMSEGILSFVRGKLFERARIDELGLRMGLVGSQTAFVAAYIEGVERAGAVESALYHMDPRATDADAGAYRMHERDHERMLQLAAAWHREHDEALMRAIHQLHMRQIIASIERVYAQRGISSIERTERVRDIVTAPSTRETVAALGQKGRALGFMYASIARKNVVGCCLSARFARLARISRLPIGRSPFDLVACM